MQANQITDLLKGQNQEDARRFANYCVKLAEMKMPATGKPKGKSKAKAGVALQNPWMANRTPQELADLFLRVAKEGLVFDGEHIFLEEGGVQFDHVAYKNKMLAVYPESKIDMSLVYKGDEFSSSKESGTVHYSHKIKNPFSQKDEDIIGAYCVIKNSRGEFITLMSPEDLEQHRAFSIDDSYWEAWFKDMALKTVIKKACRRHFEDLYIRINQMDDDAGYNMENPVDLNVEWKGEIDKINDLDELREYYLKNKGRGKAFDEYVTARKNIILTPSQQ